MLESTFDYFGKLIPCTLSPSVKDRLTSTWPLIMSLIKAVTSLDLSPFPHSSADSPRTRTASLLLEDRRLDRQSCIQAYISARNFFNSI